MSAPLKLTVVMTHPVQYYAPWFRYVAACCPEIDLTVLYATQPTPEQQGVGFGRAFSWDILLTEGYRCHIVRPAHLEDNVHSDVFWGLDVPEIGGAIYNTQPDVALIAGWHSVTLMRALWACWRRGIPVLYRGDTHLGNAPVGWRRLAWITRTWLLLCLFDGYLSVGRRAHEYLRWFGVPESRMFAAPHCVDNAFFAASAAPHQTNIGRAAARRFFGLNAEDFVVLFVGKLESHKRPLDLVRAVARLGSRARLLVVGTGQLEQQCRCEAERLGVRVAWAGFLNQSELGRAYAVADCLVLPSEGETWGLVVNEALATGLPCVVSDRVGCALDMITPGEQGEIFPTGDVAALATALKRVWETSQSGHDWATTCQARAAAYSFEAATAGLLAACQAAVSRRLRRSMAVENYAAPRVIACCGSMVALGGLERMTFEVLRVLRERGAAVHCIVNTWGNHQIVALAEQVGASWSTGYYWHRFDRHTRDPIKLTQFAWDILMTSLGLLKDAWHFRPTHVLIPELTTALRNAPALVLLRLAGVQVIMRVGNVPERGTFYKHLWGKFLPPLVSQFVPNSYYSMERLRATGVPARKITVIRNAVGKRFVSPDTDIEIVELARSRRTLLSVGQLAPFKGTQIFVEAALALLAAGSDIQALIVGCIPDWPPEFVEYVRCMQDKVAAAGAGDHIRFVGERQNVLEIMRASYLLVAPFLPEESFGNVVLEAKSVGLPVVAFPTGGLVELVEHGVTGYLCQDLTLPSLLEGIQFFLDGPAAREKASAASLASLTRPDIDHNPERFRRRWWALFEEKKRL
jgi:glycosyltransferase involved in cell wall biosynthesis